MSRVNDVDPIVCGYDDDSLLNSIGALTIVREPQTGRESTATLGGVTTTRTYTPFGEPDVFTVEHDGTVLYREDLDYDARGWITDIERTQSGGTSSWSFGYDLRGRLETVEIDGIPAASYGYDANSNRTSYDGPFGTVTPAEVTVDARDRLLAYGGLTFTYTDAGDLLTKTQAGQTVTYDYDVFGNLRQIDRPGGPTVEYVTDGANRRIGKRVDGVLVQGFLYQDALNPIAELDGAGNVIARFVYGTRANVPDYMVKGGATYRVVADHLGSPRLVVDVVTGDVVQEMRFDEFGRVLLDTNPGFQPFGFAGGLYDRHTGLVRFGARDLDPRLGRWTNRDPIGFTANEWNLYAYVDADPLNFVDTTGRSKGGKRRLAGDDPLTQGYNPNLPAEETREIQRQVQEWLNSPAAKESPRRAKNLRGWLKVAKRLTTGAKVLGPVGTALSLIFVDELNADEEPPPGCERWYPSPDEIPRELWPPGFGPEEGAGESSP